MKIDDATRARMRMVVAHLTETLSDADALVDDLLTELPAAHGIGDNNPPEPIFDLEAIDPERLVIVPTDQLAALFDLQYKALVERHAELLAGASRWMDQHEGGRKPIVDDAENDATSDFMRQISGFAGDTGEVETTRKKVKLCVYQAGLAIDAWFGNLRADIMALHGPTKNPPMNSMQYLQTQYLVAKARKEAAERQRLADEAAAEAKRKAEEARKLAEQDAPEEAVEAVTEVALEAEVRAAEIAIDAAAPARDMVRSRSAMGTTTGLRTEWTAVVTDMMALCKAVAEGKAPVTFVTADLPTIQRAVRAKVAPVRECPGLEIKETFSASRRGA